MTRVSLNTNDGSFIVFVFEKQENALRFADYVLSTVTTEGTLCSLETIPEAETE